MQEKIISLKPKKGLHNMFSPFGVWARYFDFHKINVN
jgi:hypothetical protein